MIVTTEQASAQQDRFPLITDEALEDLRKRIGHPQLGDHLEGVQAIVSASFPAKVYVDVAQETSQ